MLSVNDALDSRAIREYVNQQLAAGMIRKLGYDWPSERIERVAAAMPEFFAVSGNMAWSLSEAIDEELVMYGDGSILEPVGILSFH
jgi:hypothetical protein